MHILLKGGGLFLWVRVLTLSLTMRKHKMTLTWSIGLQRGFILGRTDVALKGKCLAHQELIVPNAREMCEKVNYVGTSRQAALYLRWRPFHNIAMMLIRDMTSNWSRIWDTLDGEKRLSCLLAWHLQLLLRLWRQLHWDGFAEKLLSLTSLVRQVMWHGVVTSGVWIPTRMWISLSWADARDVLSVQYTSELSCYLCILSP